MTEQALHRTEHSLIVSAPPQRLYDLVADVSRWPAVFGPTVHVRHLERGERGELFELWALVHGEVENWTSRRVLDPVRRYVRFDQVRSRPPITSMGGGWLFRELSSGETEVVLRHRFSTADDGPGTVERTLEALDRNSREELAALARIAERGSALDDLVFSFTDVVELPGGTEAVYEFVRRADLWPDRLPHVNKVALSERPDGIQQLEMETLLADGSAHLTRSVRVCASPEWIAYKQLLTPRLLTGHSGLWTFGEGADGPVAVSTHTVALDPDAVAGVLGPDATLADARAYVTDALTRNSRTTLTHAGRFAAR